MCYHNLKQIIKQNPRKRFCQCYKKKSYTRLLYKIFPFLYSFFELYYSKTRKTTSIKKILFTNAGFDFISSFDGVEFQMDPNYCGTR